MVMVNHCSLLWNFSHYLLVLLRTVNHIVSDTYVQILSIAMRTVHVSVKNVPPSKSFHNLSHGIV